VTPDPASAAARHRRAAEIFDCAFDLPEDRRPSFVEQACGADDELRSRVMALLAAERSAPSAFLAQTAAQLTVNHMVEASASITGTQLGPYVVGRPIGAGGMGTVYEAHDTRLDRKVAIKILPPAFAGDPERVSRFRQEARAVSLLNHPNIVSIFDAELDAGRSYIATELVEGETLGQYAARGPMEPKLLFEIAVQICAALGAAHEAGIVHRDIKPDNVMVRPDGIVKVLDFGLAKLHESLSPQAGDLRTRPGSVAGTPQYLSPEQVLGQKVGPQSDIFSLGVLLYELAAGRRPFDGATDGSIFTAIVSQAPIRPSETGPVDKHLEALILRALEKDPELRFQTANDMRSALRLLQRGPQSAGHAIVPQAARARQTVMWRRLALAGAGGMALMGILWMALRTVPPRLPDRFQRMTFGEGEEIYPNLSPDGKQFIYASDAAGNWDIYLQRTGGSTGINLTVDSPANDTEPALSHDGSKIAFRSERGEGGIYVMEATGENPRKVSAHGHLPSWSPDGKSIAYCDDTFVMPNDRGSPGSRLHVVDLATGAQRDLDVGDGVQPNWSPDGRRIAYWGISGLGNNREIFTVPAAGGTPMQVTHDPAVDWDPVWAPSGRELYYISDRGGTMNIWRVGIDERTGATHGPPEPVTTPAVYVRFLSWTADGTKFLYSQAQNRINLSAVDFDPARLEVTGKPTPVGGNYNIGNFSLSPDEKQIVHDTVGDPEENLWIVNVDGSGRRKLTSDTYRNRMPRWSPKGDEILYISTRGGNYQEWMIRTDGSGLRQVTVGNDSVNTGVWIDGGRRVVASLFGRGLAMIDPNRSSPIADPKALPGIEPRNGFSYAFVSPPEDGLLLGHIAGDGANPVVMYSLAESKLTYLGIKGTRPAWVPGTHARYFVFLRDDSCYLYDRQERREKRLFSTGHNQMYFLQMSDNGRKIYFTETVRDAHIWMGEMAR
jgi:Tol biopolymer transport system component